MKLGTRTAKLVREAAVAGFVQGSLAAGPYRGEDFPLDSDIWLAALRTARSFPDLYPTLKAVAFESEELAEQDRQRVEALRELINGASAEVEREDTP